jgi:hypothetical protein
VIAIKLKWFRRIVELAMLLAAALYAVPCQSQSYSAPSQQKNSPQGLWVSNSVYFDEFQGGSLQKSGHPAETFGLTFAECCPDFPSLTFDSAGNLWVAFVADQGSGVGELTRNQLNASKPHLAFHVTLSYEENPNPLFFPESIAFDPAGDLWVATTAPMNNLFEYTPDQLKISGGPTPASTISFPTDSGIDSRLIRFDASGDLWLSSQFSMSDGSVAAIEYTPAQITEMQMGMSPTPALAVVAGPSSAGISAIAFDKAGNLWLAAPTPESGANLMWGGTLEMFNVAGKTGTVTQPDVVITPAAISSTNQSMDRPSGLAFDDKGGLWVSSNISSGRYDTGFMVKFTADQLAASGSPVPRVVLYPNRKATNLDYPSPIAIGSTVK